MDVEDRFSVTEGYQQKLLALLLADPQFCEVSREFLSGEHFSNKALQWYWSTISTAPIPLTSVTLQEELAEAVRAGLVQEEDLTAYCDLYKIVAQKPLPVEEEYLKDKMLAFIRTQNIKDAVMETFDLIKTGDWERIEQIVTDAANSGVDFLELGTTYFAEYQARIANRLEREVERKLSTGIPELDQLMFGGIKNKQLALIVGGTGRGKSIFLEWLARVAILLGKKVVYYTFELSEEDIAERFDSMFAKVKYQHLSDYSGQVAAEVGKYAQKFGENLIIKEYPADEATVSTLKAHVRQLSMRGIVPDLIIVDYLDLLKPHRTYGTTVDELDSITKALHGMAKSLDTRIWTATQQNRGAYSAEVITPDETHVAGALAKLFTVDIAIFMAQTKDEKEDNVMRLILAKNRNGPTGKQIKIDTDYAFMTFYRPPLPTQDSNDEEINNKDTTTSENEENSRPSSGESETSGSGSTESGGDVLVLPPEAPSTD